MGRSSVGVSWQEVMPWLKNLEDWGMQGRVVIDRTGTHTIRVVVTVRRKASTGHWYEVVREGETVTTMTVDGPQRAAIRAIARCLYELELRHGGEKELAPYVETLPSSLTAPSEG